MTLYEWLSLLVSLLGLGAIAWSVRFSGKQTQATVFADFSARYAEIDQATNFVSGYYRRDTLNSDETEAYYTFLDRYFDLLHQEFELHRRGMIDRGIWRIWVDYAKAHAEEPRFAPYWESDRGRPSFSPNRHFVEFVERLRN